MLVSWLVVIIAVVGLLMWVLPASGKVSEVGRIMFFCGLLALCFALGGKTVRLP